MVYRPQDERVEAVVRRWLRGGAHLIIAAPSIAEAIRGGPRDAAANRMIRAVKSVVDTTEAIARDAGRRLAEDGSDQTFDAFIVATAHSCGATDILTTDPRDMTRLCGDGINVIAL